MRRSLRARNAAADAVCRQLDGGQLAFYDGVRPSSCDARVSTPPLAVLTFSTPAFAPAQQGIAVSAPLPATWATQAGRLTWWRAVTASGVPVCDGTVGVAGPVDMVVSVDTVTPHAVVSVAQLTYVEPEGV
jgi:hypothetical protein